MKYVLFIIALLISFHGLAQEKGLSPIKSTQSQQGKTYAVVVGVSDYQDGDIPDLKYADKDALAFAGYLQSAAGGSLDEDHLKVMVNEQATQAQFGAALDWLWEVAKENDKVIIYFSGHGDVERKSITQPGYLLCWDAPPNVYMGGGAFNVRDLNDVVSTLSIQNKARVVLIIDACRAGKLSGSQIGGSQATAANLAKQYGNEIKILSCQPDEYSIEGEQWGGGRGAFSYHLLNGLYGMADKNSDLNVTLTEIDRYLEDHVAIEVAPQNQLPMTVGNGRKTLTVVSPEILDEQLKMENQSVRLFASTDSRGIEDEVLADADTSIVEMYVAFQKSLKDKRFLVAEIGRAENDYADFYYQKLISEPSLDGLHSSLRRNYAAALQDDAQQVMNKWMKIDLSEYILSKKTKMDKYQLYPRYLERAVQLLGSEHYMYRVLQARLHFFEGYLLALSTRNPDKVLGEKALAEFQKALDWEPELPQAYSQMSEVYGYNLMQPDSAEQYALRAMELQPSWVLPYLRLTYLFAKKYKQFDRAKQYLVQATQLDSSSALVWHHWGIFCRDRKKFAKSEQYYKKAIQLDSSYTMAYMGLGLNYNDTGRYAEAEKQFKKGLQLDSTFAWAYGNLGNVYLYTNRYTEAEKQYKKAIQLDSTDLEFYSNLGNLYLTTRRFAEAEQLLKKSLQLDSTYDVAYYNLACIRSQQSKINEAFEYLEKDIQLGDDDYDYMINDTDLAPLREKKERWAALMKKYFPEKFE